MKPWEANVHYNIEGTGIYLYNFAIPKKNKYNLKQSYRYIYLFKINSSREIFYVLINLLKIKLIGKNDVA